LTPLVLYALAFAGLSILVGCLIAAKRVPFVARFAVCVLTPWLAFAVWQAARPPAGWPKAAQPPAGGTLVGGTVRTPVLGDAGEIDLWVEPPGAQRPRAYRLPYSPELQQRLIAALAAKRATHDGLHLVVQSGSGPQHGSRHGGLRFVSAQLPAKR
jgi:hypothetical protein